MAGLLARLAPPPPGDPFWRGFLLALLIASAGGAVFAWLRLPLAWMLGAMFATTAAAVLRLPLRMPHAFRTVMTSVLGVLLGSAFSPGILDQLGAWTLTIAFLLLYILASTFVVLLFLRLVARFDPVTAFFSAVPGGFQEMVTIGRAMGGDERVIALNHATRILMVVMLIPIWYRLFEGYVPPPDGIGGGGPAPNGLDLAILAGCGVFGALAGRALRLPAAMLLGPLALSAAVHLAGLTQAKPPALVIGVAQVIIGAGIGVRFAGVTFRQLRRYVAISFCTTALAIAITVAFAIALKWLTGMPVLWVVLAYAPGGLAEMSLVALAIGADAAFVASHHLVRISAIVMLIPLLFRLFRPLLTRISR